MSFSREPYVGPEEYLARERAAETKSEYVDGVIVAMSGASERHNLIVANAIVALGVQLRGSRCRVYPSDLKVRMPGATRYFYPDVSVICGPTEFADDMRDVALNPTVVIEVLSESTAAFDQGTKRLSYLQIETLRAFLLVDQDSAQVEVYTREDGGGWHYVHVADAAASIDLPSIECVLSVTDFYANVTF